MFIVVCKTLINLNNVNEIYQRRATDEFDSHCIVIEWHNGNESVVFRHEEFEVVSKKRDEIFSKILGATSLKMQPKEIELPGGAGCDASPQSTTAKSAVENSKAVQKAPDGSMPWDTALAHLAE